MRLGLLLALVLPATGVLSGCSWIFVQPLRDRYVPGDFPVCTTSAAVPVVDTLLSLTTIGSAIYVTGRQGSHEAPVITGALFATMWLSSAVYGYMKTSDCRDAQADHEENRPRRLLRPRAPPAGYPEPSPAAAPAVTVPPSAPAPRQREDEDEPGRRRAPPQPAGTPNVPSSGA